jgi:hypothetical protein
MTTKKAAKKRVNKKHNTPTVVRKNGFVSAVVPVLYAGVPDHQGRVFSEEALQRLANGAGYWYDTRLGALLTTVSAQDKTLNPHPPTPVVSLADAPELASRVLDERDELAGNSNAQFLHETVQYTKVWAFLSQLLDSDLPARTLISALTAAGRLQEGDLVRVCQHGEAAHHLIQQYLMTKPKE